MKQSDLIEYIRSATTQRWKNTIPVDSADPLAPLIEAINEQFASARQLDATHDRQLGELADVNVRAALYMDALTRIGWIGEEYVQTGDLAQFLEHILDEIMSPTATRYGAIGMFSTDGELTHFITRGVSEEIKARINRFPTGKGVLGQLYKDGNSVCMTNISNSPSSCGFPPNHPEMRCLLGVPIKNKDVVKGVIYLSEKKDGEPFTPSDETFAEVFAAEVEQIMMRASLVGELRHENTRLRKTQRKLEEARTQLLQSEKLASIGQLAAGVAHEINNPVGYINSNITSLKKYIADLFELLGAYEQADSQLSDTATREAIRALKARIDLAYLKEDIQDLMGESQEGVARVKQIVQDLKDFSHLGKVEWQWADLHHGLDSTLNIAHNETKYKAEVVKEYGDLPQVECIISQLNQVFMNLLVNASHAIEEQGTITVRTGTDGDDEVWVAVEDTGKGMDDMILKKIFDPFYTTKPVGKGTGLGLSLSYGIIKKHGGRIDVESEPGKGTIFTVRLPVRHEPVSESDAA